MRFFEVLVNHPTASYSEGWDGAADGFVSGGLKIDATVFGPISDWDDSFSS